MRSIASACALTFAIFICSSPADAGQALASATVTGLVRDSSQAVVAGAAVRLHNHDTNQVWDATTDGSGRFRFVYIPVGDYHLSVEAQGFSTTGVNLTLSVGQALDVPLTIAPAPIAEAVDVSAPAPVVEAGRTQVADRITPHEVDTLPLNGRNYLDLALLAPNVSRTNLRTNDRFAETSAVPGTGISVAGQRNLGNTFLVDGVSANDDAADLAGAYYGEEVIREFQVITSGGVAEFGRASAGTINVVTQSGTNQPRGRAYGFFRDDAFDARNPLAVQKDPLDQQQYGFSFGGPIVKDRTFWFANIEETRQNRTGIITIAPSDVAAIDASLDAAGGQGVRVATGPYSTGYHTTNVFGRVDHQATAGSRLEVRYSIYDVGSPNARNVGGLNDVSRGTRLDDRDQTLAANYQSSLSASTINELRAQWTRSRLGAGVNDLAGPAINISGVASFGTATFSPTSRDLDVFEAVDTLTLQHGSQLIKFGADLLDNRLTIAFPGALQGVYTFSSLTNFQRGAYVNFQQAFGPPSQFQSNPNLGVFAQDEWRPVPGVTINAGIRYDLQWLPDPIQLDANNLSPRVGVAYAFDPQTVIRASGGLYFDRIPLRATSNALQRDGVNYKVAVLSFGQTGAPVFPAVLPSYPASVLTAVTTIDPNIQDGYSEQASVQVERAVGRVGTATVGYSHLRGHGIIMSRNINVPTLTAAQAAAQGVANLGRPDPRFGNISQFDSLGDSWFDGLTLSLATRTAPWGSARVSYTLSNSQDDAGNAFFNTPQDNLNILDDKGPSDNDQRHRLVVSGNHVLRGFQIGYLLSYATGAPFNIQTGNDRNNDTNANDRPVGVGRNSGRQPATSSFDVRLSRTFTRGAAQRLEVMVEAFNLFNHVNILSVNNTFGTGTVPLPAFGQPTAAGDPRQVQLGVRWSF